MSVEGSLSQFVSVRVTTRSSKNTPAVLVGVEVDRIAADGTLWVGITAAFVQAPVFPAWPAAKILYGCISAGFAFWLSAKWKGGNGFERR